VGHLFTYVKPVKEPQVFHADCAGVDLEDINTKKETCILCDVCAEGQNVC